MNRPNKTGLNDLAVLNSRRAFGVNKVSRLGNAVKEGQFTLKSLFTNVQFWVVTILIVCTGLSLYLVREEDGDVRYRVLFNAVCVFASYIVSIFTLTYVSHHTQKKANDQINILNNPIQVLRNGRQITVNLSDVVVNDLVVLEEGNTIPADGILLKSAGMRVDESTVGGNNDVYKRVGAGPSKGRGNVYPADWMIGGSVVFEGNGTMKVTRVGDQTEFGRSASLESGNVDDRVPYVYLVGKVSKCVAAYILIYSILIFAVCFLVRDGLLYHILTIPANFIVAVLPIIVPYVVSLITHQANKKLSKMGVKVKNMNTPYALGMTSTIISGRFGIVSSGMMTVTKAYVGCAPTKDSWILVDDKATMPESVIKLFYKSLSLSISVSIKDASNPQKRSFSGTAEEIAMVNWMYDNGIDVAEQREGDVVLDRLLSMRESGICSVLVQGDNENFIFVQGKPKEVFAHCRYVQSAEGRIEIDEYIRLLYKSTKVESPYIVSVAYARVPSSVKKIGSVESLKTIKMTLLGIVYIDDHIRQGVNEFAYSMETSNVGVKIVTSLRKESAALLAQKSNILNDYEASHLEDEDSLCLTSEELMLRNNGRIPYDAIKKMKVISQVSLSDRLDIVKTLQQQGEIVMVVASEARVEQLQDVADVAVTLRSENSDTHRVNEVSINRNHLYTLQTAIKIGRGLIRNEGRIYSLMVGISIALVVLNSLGFLFSGSPIMSIIQMFWLNIVCIGISAFAVTSIKEEVSLKDPTMNDYNNFAKKTDFIRLAIVFAIFDIAMVLSFWLIASKMEITQVSDIWTKDIQWGLPTNPREQFSVYERTIIMTLFVMCVFWNLVSVKIFGNSESMLSHFTSYWKLYLMACLIPATHFLMVQFGQDWVLAKSINAMDWVYLLGFTSLFLVYIEIRQFVKRCFFSKRPK